MILDNKINKVVEVWWNRPPGADIIFFSHREPTKEDLVIERKI
jgi:hypothetical protein